MAPRHASVGPSLVNADDATQDISIQQTVITSVKAKRTTPQEPPVLKPASQPPLNAEAGRKLGPYELQQEIGRGGMGLVLQGHDQALKRDVAIKILHSQTREDPIKRMRFIKEAQITGQLEHPGIVPVHYLGWDENGNEFFSMKLATGESLDKILERWHAGKAGTRAQFPLTRLLSIFERVAETVGFAHSHRVMHRDLKPSNVMIGTHGEVWVLDWGLAKVIGAPDDDPTTAGKKPSNSRIQSDVANDVTLDGLVVGTPEYMAPEQAAGEVLDEGVDIFALGALLYEILTANPPRSGKTVNEVVSKAAQGRFTPVRRMPKGKNAPPALAAITEKCLQPQRGDRYAQVGDLLQDLRNFAAGVEVSAMPDDTFEKIRRFTRKHRKIVALSGSIAGVLLLVITIASILVAQKDREAKQEQDKAMQAKEEALQAVVEQQKAQHEKQAALQEIADKAQRRLKAFQPYVQAMDLLTRDQMPEKAAALLAEALATDPDFPEAQFALAEAYRAAGIPKKAAEAYLKADELSMKIGGRHNLHAIVAAGFTYDGAGKYDGAMECFERAEKFGADDPLALVGRCFRLAYERRMRDAKDVADACLKRAPHLWEAHFAFGYVTIEMARDGMLPAASARTDGLAALRKALELSPRQAEVCSWIGAVLADTGHPTQADKDEARSYYNRAIELEPLNGNRYVVRALYRHSQGDGAGAEADFDDAKRLGAWEPMLRLFDARKAEMRGDLETAFKEIGIIVGMTREWPPHVFNWLCLGFELKKMDEIMPAYERWAKTNPNYPYVYALRSALRINEGDYKGSIGEAKKGLEIAPYNNMLHRYLISALLKDRQHQEALLAVNKAMKLIPNDARIMLQKGRVLIEMGTMDEAEKVLDEVDKLEPRFKGDTAKMRTFILKYAEQIKQQSKK